MIYYPHFRDFTIRTIQEMIAFRIEAVTAISMIVAHESKGGTYLRQLRGGPALGAIQMEPDTHDDTWLHCDSIKKRAAMLGIRENVEALEYDLRYNIFMARCRLLMDTRPLPRDEEGMARYLKGYWNSAGGKASSEEYLQDYRSFIKL